MQRLSGTDAFFSGPLLPFLSIEKEDRAMGEDCTDDGHRTWLGPQLDWNFQLHGHAEQPCSESLRQR